MRIAPDNIFPGARVKLDGNNYTVIKVNAKSFYATTMSFAEYKDKWDNRLRGTTFLKFCEINEISQYKYSDAFDIEENEFNRKELAETNAKIEYKINKADKAEIIEWISLQKKKRGRVVLSPQISVSSIKSVFFLEEKDDCYLVNMDHDYVLCSPLTDEWIKISTVYDFRTKYDHVPWELLSCFEQKEIAVA